MTIKNNVLSKEAAMNTKYMPEFGVQTWAYHLSMSYPFDLDYLSPDDRRYNIYVATLIPKLNIDEERNEEENLAFCGKFYYHIK